MMESDPKRSTLVFFSIVVLMIALGHYSNGLACGAVTGFVLGVTNERRHKLGYLLFSVVFAFAAAMFEKGTFNFGIAAALFSLVLFHPFHALGKVDWSASEDSPQRNTSPTLQDGFILLDDNPHIEKSLRKSWS
jgi:hypothetical protein